MKLESVMTQILNYKSVPPRHAPKPRRMRLIGPLTRPKIELGGIEITILKQDADANDRDDVFGIHIPVNTDYSIHTQVS